MLLGGLVFGPAVGWKPLSLKSSRPHAWLQIRLQYRRVPQVHCCPVDPVTSGYYGDLFKGSEESSGACFKNLSQNRHSFQVPAG